MNTFTQALLFAALPFLAVALFFGLAALSFGILSIGFGYCPIVTCFAALGLVLLYLSKL